jgi:hypothetical protein
LVFFLTYYDGVHAAYSLNSPSGNLVLFILGIGVCMRVPPSGSQQVDFVRFNKIIFGWLIKGFAKAEWFPELSG